MNEWSAWVTSVWPANGRSWEAKTVASVTRLKTGGARGARTRAGPFDGKQRLVPGLELGSRSAGHRPTFAAPDET
jgi:hypothetical protein